MANSFILPRESELSQQEHATEGGFSPAVARKQRETNVPNEILERNKKGRKDIANSGFQHQMNENQKRNKK